MVFKKIKGLLLISLIVSSVAGMFSFKPVFTEDPKRNNPVAPVSVKDPFAEYLRSIPLVLQILDSVNSGFGAEAITTKEIIFSSKDKVNTVYGILSFPRQAGKHPAILILHGGSGNAAGLRPLVEKFARRGYVAFACDMPGYCGTNITPHSSGPWKSKPAGDEAPRFDIADGLNNSSLVDSEVAGLEGFNLLCSQSNVDTSRVGITGFSWGGYSTTMLSGLLGSRVKAAYSYWGCGYYDKGSFWKGIIEKLPEAIRQEWLTYFDAGRRANHIRANFFIEAASDDTYFWPPAVSATLKAIPGAKNHVWGPNVNHTLVPTSERMQELYFDYYLKGIGSPFAVVDIAEVKLLKDSSKRITIKIKAPEGVTLRAVDVYYSEPADNWQSRIWIPLNAKPQGDHQYQVSLSPDLVSKHVSFYAYAIDSRNVATSSYLY